MDLRSIKTSNDVLANKGLIICPYNLGHDAIGLCWLSRHIEFPPHPPPDRHFVAHAMNCRCQSPGQGLCKVSGEVQIPYLLSKAGLPGFAFLVSFTGAYFAALVLSVMTAISVLHSHL